MITDIFLNNDYSLSRRNARGSSAPTFKAYKEVTFDSALVRNKKIPRYLLRSKNEKYTDYFKRVDQFFNTYS